MRIHQCEQGTQEWLRLRAGIPTASEFDQIVTPGGKASKSEERYMFTLLAEKLMGRPTTGHVSWWMERGSQTEADAVSFYELQKDLDTVPVGFITNDAETVGASPDRLVGEDGLLEVKCPSEWVHMAYLLGSGSPYEAYKCQCQGQLWITGRKWVDVLSFHPDLPPALTRIGRDESFIELLAAGVTAFSEQLEKLYVLSLQRGLKAVRPEPQEDLLDQMRASLVASQRQSGAIQ